MRLPLSKRDRFRLHLPYSSRNTPDAEKVVVWRWKILSIISVLFLLAIFYFFLFSSYFRFTSVESTETLFIPNIEVTTAIDTFISKKRFFILPQNNYFLLSKKGLRDILEKDFKLRKVTIVKDAPTGLFIYFKEQISVFVASLPNAQAEIHLFDHTGEMIQTLSRQEYNSQLPFVTIQTYDSVNKELAKIVLGSWEIANLRNSNFRILTYIQQDDQFVALTNKNFEIRFSLTSDASAQVTNFEVLQQAFLKGEPLPTNYIELRFGKKVFVK